MAAPAVHQPRRRRSWSRWTPAADCSRAAAPVRGPARPALPHPLVRRPDPTPRPRPVPAAAGGPTSAANAQGLCEACNYAKEAPGWTSAAPADSRRRSPAGTLGLARRSRRRRDHHPHGARHRTRPPLPPGPTRPPRPPNPASARAESPSAATSAWCSRADDPAHEGLGRVARDLTPPGAPATARADRAAEACPDQRPPPGTRAAGCGEYREVGEYKGSRTRRLT